MDPKIDQASKHLTCPRCDGNTFRVKIVARGFVYGCGNRNCRYTIRWTQALPQGDWT